MSLDLYVFIDHPAPLIESEWQQALDDRHLPVLLQKGVEVSKLSGMFPVTLKGKKTGFYFLKDSIADLAPDYPEIAAAKIDGWAAYNLNYGGHSLECASAMYAAAALVAKFNGRAFDPQAGKFVSYQDLVTAGDQCLALGPTLGLPE